MQQQVDSEISEAIRNMQQFHLPGVGTVTAFGGRVPITRFEDGTYCSGLRRSLCEVRPLGYNDIEVANFEHEAAHLFVSSKCGFVPDSVLRRSAEGCEFECPVQLSEAGSEERLVLGLQAAFVNAGDTLPGFHQHLAGAAIENARRRFSEEYHLDLDNLVAEFRSLLQGAVNFS
jgi:hypothetical protein